MHPWLVRYVIPPSVPFLGGQDLSIPAFFFWATVGFILSTGLLLREGDRTGEPPRRLLDLALLFLVGGLVGGRLGHILLESPRTYLEHPERIFDLWSGGLVFYAGLLTSILLVALYTRRHGMNLLRVLDVFTPALCFGMIFGRLGCLSAGCCYGRPIDFPFGWELPWGVTFWGPPVPELLQGVPLHPTQIYLALLELVLFVFTTRLRARQRFVGQVFWSWAVANGLGRFVVEIFRFDADRGLYLGGWLSTSQIIAAALAITGAVMWTRCRRAEGR